MDLVVRDDEDTRARGLRCGRNLDGGEEVRRRLETHC
jgi:hypothetical protein